MSGLNLTPDEINELFPITGMKLCKGGLMLIRCSNLSPGQIKRQSLRGVVGRLSKRSLANFAWMVACSKVTFKSLLTLTYGANYPNKGEECKRHLRAFMAVMRRHYNDFSFVWFLEFQSRGAPHFHLLLTLENPQDTDRAIVASAWARIVETENWPYSGLRLWDDKLIRWSSGFTRDAVRKFHNRKECWENVKSEDGAIRYVVKYATKPYQKSPPRWFEHTGRFWGSSRDVPNRDYLQFRGSDKDVKELCALLGRNMDKWEVLPKIILINNSKFDKFRENIDNSLK